MDSNRRIDRRIDVDDLLQEGCHCAKRVPQHGGEIRHHLENESLVFEIGAMVRTTRKSVHQDSE